MKTVMNLRLEIDRLFDDFREKMEIKYSFQNEDPTHIELLRESGKEYVYTTMPKRMYVVSSKLYDRGIKIYFKALNDERYDALKELVFNRFSKKLFISPKLKKKENYISGYFLLTNLN